MTTLTNILAFIALTLAPFVLMLGVWLIIRSRKPAEWDYPARVRELRKKYENQR